MRCVETVIGDLHVSVELQCQKGPEGPGVGFTISGAVAGTPVEGSLQDLFSRGALLGQDGRGPVRVPAPLIAQIDEWCMQFTI